MSRYYNNHVYKLTKPDHRGVNMARSSQKSVVGRDAVPVTLRLPCKNCDEMSAGLHQPVQHLSVIGTPHHVSVTVSSTQVSGQGGQLPVVRMEKGNRDG